MIPSHAVKILKIINQCLVAKEIFELEDIWLSMQEAFNIDAVIVAVSESSSANDIENTSYIRTFGVPDYWAAVYRKQNFVLIDPVVPALFASGGEIVSFSEAYRDFGNAEGAADFIVEAKKAGLADGYACATRAVGFSDAACSTSVTFSEGNLSADDHEAIKTILPHLNQIASRPGNLLKPVLNDDQIACLKWAGEGKTHWETGKILGISVRTVKYHLKNAKAIMGVSSTTVAVKKGIVLDLFRPDQ